MCTGLSVCRKFGRNEQSRMYHVNTTCYLKDYRYRKGNNLFSGQLFVGILTDCVWTQESFTVPG